jgi:hypothetical protein
VILWEAESLDDRARLLRPHPDWSVTNLREFGRECLEHVLWVLEPWLKGDDRMEKGMKTLDRLRYGPMPENFLRVRRAELEELEQDIWRRSGASLGAPVGPARETTPWAPVAAAYALTFDDFEAVCSGIDLIYRSVGPNRIGNPSAPERSELRWQEARFCERFGIAGIVEPP